MNFVPNEDESSQLEIYNSVKEDSVNDSHPTEDTLDNGDNDNVKNGFIPETRHYTIMPGFKRKDFNEKDNPKNQWTITPEIKKTKKVQTEIIEEKNKKYLHQNSPKIQITAELISPYHPVDKNVEYKLVQFTKMKIEMNYGDNKVKRTMIPLDTLIIDKPAEEGIAVKFSREIEAGESLKLPFKLTFEDSPDADIPIKEAVFPNSRLTRLIRDQHFYTYLIKEMKNEEVDDDKYRKIGCLHWVLQYNCEMEYSSLEEPRVIGGGNPEYRPCSDSPPFPIRSLTTIRANCNNCYIYINNENELIYFEFHLELENEPDEIVIDPDFTNFYKIYKLTTENTEEVVGFMISINDQLEENLKRTISSMNNQTWQEIIENLIKVPFLELIRQIKGKLNSLLGF